MCACAYIKYCRGVNAYYLGIDTIKYSQYKDFIIFFSVALFGNIIHFHMQQKKVFL